MAVVDVGQIISGKYKLLRLVGDGGMGAVYEAEHLGLGTHVAIKVLHADMAHRAGLNDRFLQEARVSAQIRSPHVVHVTDVDRTPDGVAYLVMELLSGEPLSGILRRETKLSAPTSCTYAVQILEALEAAHALGVIHRDLKPDNVFVTFEGGRPVLKLIDFGIAKLKREEGALGAAKNLTVAGMMMGTPEYMAPEQAYAADKVDVRADVYAVGAMLYEMLGGQTPVSGDDPRVVIGKVERGEVLPLVHLAPETPPELAGLVHRAMAPKPELRFSTATEMRLAIEGFLAGKHSKTAKLGQVAPVVVNDASQGGIGTGTVMGAPAAEILASAPRRTVHAVPFDPGHAQGFDRSEGRDPRPFQPEHGPAYPSALPERPSTARRSSAQKSGSGLVIALAIVALLLGAGAAVAYVLGTRAPEPVVTTFPTAAPQPTSPRPVVSPGQPSSTTPVAVPTLAPPSPAPEPVTKPARPEPKTPDAPPAASSAPPFTFPSALPSGFPSSLPSVFPLPSAFPLPSGLPPMPWAPAPAPAPSAAP